MATAITKKPLSGTFLRPGVSLNRRLYSKEMIGKAVARMQARIADPDGLPIVMRTSHGAGDDSRLITGRIVAVKQEADGSATFDARWYDTAPARDIAELVYPDDGGPPALRSVSIHGWFIGERKVEHGGEQVVTADDLEIDFIDFTASPGVVTALIDPPKGSRPSESAAHTPGRSPISETWEARVAETDTIAAPDAAPALEYTAAQKRDALKAGQAMKNADGEPAYTIKNKADLRRAIRAVGRGGADHDKIRAHVIDRAKALGLTGMIPDNWNADGSLKESAPATRFGEIRECYDGPEGRAGFAIDAYNGPVSLTLRAPSIDPSGLRAVATAAIVAALDALGALDPDMDADIDVPGDPGDDSEAGEGDDIEDATGDDECPAPGSGCPCGCGCAVPDEMAGGPGCPCVCGCEVCGSAPRGESAAVSPPGAAIGAEYGPELSVPAEASGYVTPAPTQAPASPPPVEESAVSETVTPAAEAATPTPAPAVGVTAEQFAALMRQQNEQFTALIAALRPAPATESAPTQQATAEPSPAPAAAPTQEAAPATPAVEAVTKADLAATVAEALKAAIPALRDSIVSEYGLPPRKGHRTTESDHGDKPMTDTEIWDNRADILLGDIGKVGA
jgi:hypothetical protein